MQRRVDSYLAGRGSWAPAPSGSRGGSEGIEEVRRPWIRRGLEPRYKGFTASVREERAVECAVRVRLSEGRRRFGGGNGIKAVRAG